MVKEPTAPKINRDDHRWDRMRSPWRSASLDHQLASGTPPGWNRALAARARYTTGTEDCRALVEDWEHFLQACQQTRMAPTLRAPLCRSRILAAEADIREMLAALSEARLESAAGIAMASLLLRDGTGPLYNRHCKSDVSAAIVNATTHIRNPTTAHLGQT